MADKAELARFLRHRREALSPADVGLPAVGRRRTPGLRRDEVAGLAAISTTYYERLEQQRGPRPSPDVLAAIASGLRLSDEERDHLYLLAAQLPPPRDDGSDELDTGLVATMESFIEPTVAWIIDSRTTVSALNPAAVAVFGNLAVAGADRTGDRTWYAGNVVWRWFTDEAWRTSWAPKDTHASRSHNMVAVLRDGVARHGYDAATSRLVADLRANSGDFADLWDHHHVTRQFTWEPFQRPGAPAVLAQCHVVRGQETDHRLLLFRT